MSKITLILLNFSLAIISPSLANTSPHDELRNDNPTIEQFCTTLCGRQNTICMRSGKFCTVSDKCSEPKTQMPLNQIDRMRVTYLHNEFRNEIASGKNTRLGTKGAENMEALSYSLELEFVAQCWANECSATRDWCRNTPNYDYVGQNIFLTTNVVLFEENLEDAIAFWKNQIRNMTEDQVDRFITRKGTYAVVQLIWGPTKIFGCGRVRFSSKVLIVCNYYPPSGIPGRQMFLPSFSGCPSKDRRCNSIFPALVGISRVPIDKYWTPPFTIGTAFVTVHTFRMVIYSQMIRWFA